MEDKASNESYRSLKQGRIDKIIKAIEELQYTEKEKDEAILPYIAQWLYDNYVNVESTCLIISTVTNINRLQDQIDNIYQGTIRLPARTKLQDFLTKEEYTTIEDVIEPRKNEGVLRGEINEDTNIKINFKLKRIFQERIIQTKKGPDTKDTPVIEAAPYELIVYDSPLLDQPRTFKMIWTSNVTSRNFVTSGESTGATIKEIANYLTDAGFSHSPKLVEGALACVINTMIINNRATIKTDIDNPGFYYDVNNDKITPVKRVVAKPSYDEMMKAHNTLSDLTNFFKENIETLATVFKWGLISEFSYAIKQAGKWIPWLYLKGSAGSGKTTMGKVVLYI